MARVDIRVIPRAAANAIDGVRSGRVVVRVTAPPADGAANAGVVAVIAKALNLPKSAVRVLTGQTSRNKTIGVEGITSAEVVRMLVSGPDRTSGTSESHPSTPPHPSRSR